ncbi:MAG: hypothetical protein V1756_02195 [Patescibacteria group bacterium]
MTIQIVPRPVEKEPIWLNVLFYLSIFLVVAAISVFFVINGLQNREEKNFQLLEGSLAQANSSPEAALEKEVLAIKRKIDDFSSLVGGYEYSSNVFGFLEGITLPKVFFSSFNLTADTHEIEVGGTTDSFQTVGQQLIVFKNEKLIKNVVLSNMGFSKEGVAFSFNLILDPKIFQKTEKNE